ncbi:hypothetical protein KP509_19G034800 [Ceratopteris richardii]|uniref:Uncharacterized protein n=1 Tax=Ceratopteris richardii TaxID=49495 RepID=A0A8T2SMH5_CERRI|nr:hypothetical protein KP509_19G034800 [Ceratopteris richardii]
MEERMIESEKKKHRPRGRQRTVFRKVSSGRKKEGTTSVEEGIVTMLEFFSLQHVSIPGVCGSVINAYSSCNTSFTCGHHTGTPTSMFNASSEDTHGCSRSGRKTRFYCTGCMLFCGGRSYASWETKDLLSKDQFLILMKLEEASRKGRGR